MTIEETKAIAAQDLKPRSSQHWLRIAFAVALVSVGLADIVKARLLSEPALPWEWMPLLIVMIGIGVMFTGTIIALAKALLPWKSRNG